MKKKILIIDDEQDICFLLSELLKSMGHDTNSANTLKEGKIKLGKFQPRLIFLDLNLPDGNGYSFIPFINRTCPEAKIIIISAYTSFEEQQKAASHGVHFFLGKPFNKEMVLKTIQQADSRPSAAKFL